MNLPASGSVGVRVDEYTADDLRGAVDLAREVRAAAAIELAAETEAATVIDLTAQAVGQCDAAGVILADVEQRWQRLQSAVDLSVTAPRESDVYKQWVGQSPHVGASTPHPAVDLSNPAGDDDDVYARWVAQTPWVG